MLAVTAHDPDPALLTWGARFDTVDAPVFRDNVRALLLTNSTVRLELSNVDFLDCGGLAEIMRAHQLAVELGRELILVHPSESVRRVLELAALEHSFTTESGIPLIAAADADPSGPATRSTVATAKSSPQGGPIGRGGAAASVGPTVASLQGELASMTLALIESQDRLDALQDLQRVGTESVDFADATSQMLAMAVEVTDSDAVVLLEWGDRGAPGTGRQTIQTAGQDQQLVDQLTGDTQRSAAAGRAGPVGGRQGKSVVTLLPTDPDRAAVLGFARASGAAYSTGDMRMIEAVASAVTRMVTLTRMNTEMVRRATHERDNQMASKLAQAVLAVAPPELAGLDLFASCVPAHDAGGDFVTFMVIDNAVHFAVGDVVGKGLLAAVVMTRAVSAARVAFLTHKPDDAAGMAAAIGAELFEFLNDRHLFVTAAVGSYRPDTGELYVCNAGHSPVLAVIDGAVTPVPATTPPLGVIRTARGRTQTLRILPGDLLVLGSDGLAEQEDPTRAMFGYDRLENLCTTHTSGGAGNLGRQILDAVTDHAAGAAQSDDSTLVILGSTAPH